MSDIEALHIEYVLHTTRGNRESPFDLIASQMEMQARLVSGSAFPEQTNQEIEEIQGRFETYFARNVGIGPSKTCKLMWAIVRRLDSKLQQIRAESMEAGTRPAEQLEDLGPGQEDDSKSPAPDSEDSHVFPATMYEFCHRVGDNLPVSKEEISSAIAGGVTDDEWVAFLSAFGASKEFVSTADSPYDLKPRPLIVLAGEKVVLPDLSSGLDAVWAFFERTARQDQRFYDKKYQRKRAAWLETRSKECLLNCFPPECVYSKLSYEDPDAGPSSTAELDILVKWGPFLLLAECKSGQFRFEEYVGDVKRLRSDIDSLVEDAFEQSCRARRAIETSGSVVFREISSGREVTIDQTQLDRLYLCTISLHHLAGFATRLSSLQEVGLFASNEYPASFCISDLDLICRFSKDPSVFLHFLEQRKLLVESNYELRADDLDLFSAYLDTRLILSDLGPEISQATFLGFSGYSNEFDSYFGFLRGELSKPPKIELQLPDSVKPVFLELRTRSDDSAKYITFALLGLSRNDLAAVGEGLSLLKTSSITPGSVARTLIHETDDEVFCFLKFHSPSASTENDRHVALRTTEEKYRRKKTIGIGMGTSQLSTREFDSAVWIEHEWIHDDKLEALLETGPKISPNFIGKRPGRNDPCPCGSGKKFKKCCLSRFS